ncbi:MAG: glutamate--tRNA ligase family protein, partial [Candidatus Omnitrophota bacterium]
MDTQKSATNFIREIIDKDISEGKHSGRVQTRFPPEPNGYLHIGHAKSICLNFGIARDYQGLCNLRFDDTNPSTEEVEYVESIMEDVKWLGFDWQQRCYYASDYFQRLYEFAVALIQKGKAYVCDETLDQ